MTARPIRRNAQTPDRNGKIFYTSTTSLSHISKKNRDHALNGNWNGYRECHILPDWLLIYKLEDNVLILTLARTGTHSNLFNK
ncbi:MAG: type II toxin-antitoxin system YafQ family toxin, partial [Clostridiales bacterium]|nr:type II toxin-antitoxin system YafQ family toxin [Clostridiales bacterium]